MDNKMFYRSPKSTLGPTKFRTPPPLANYDADDEGTLEFNITKNFTLPDGTYALDPAALKRIEDATEMMRNFEIDTGLKFATEVGEDDAEDTESDKENEAPVTPRGGMKMGGNEKNAMFELDEERDQKAGDGPDTDGYSTTDGQAPSEADSTEALWSLGKITTQIRTDNVDDQIVATSLKDANTQIWLLKSVLKDLQYDIEQLKIVNAGQASTIQALTGNTTGKQKHKDTFYREVSASVKKTDPNKPSDNPAIEVDGSGEKTEKETIYMSNLYQPTNKLWPRVEKRKIDSIMEMVGDRVPLIDGQDRSKRAKQAIPELGPSPGKRGLNRHLVKHVLAMNTFAFKDITPGTEDTARALNKALEEEMKQLGNVLSDIGRDEDRIGEPADSRPEFDESMNPFAWRPTGDPEVDCKALDAVRKEHVRLLAKKERRQRAEKSLGADLMSAFDYSMSN